MHRVAVEPDLAFIGLIDARQDLDQSALARSVLAEQRVDLARAQANRNVVEGDHARKLLADARHLQAHRRRDWIRLDAHWLGRTLRVLPGEIPRRAPMSLRRVRPRTTAPRIKAPMRNCTQKGSALTSTSPSSISEIRTIART